MKEFFTLAQADGSVQTQSVQSAPATTTATTAQASGTPAQPAQKPPSGDGLGIMIPFLIIMGGIIFISMRSQSKEKKRREEMLSGIRAGDKVVTIGGIYGVVDTVTDKTFKLKIADNVKIEVSRNAVTTLPEEKDAKKDEKKAETDKK